MQTVILHLDMNSYFASVIQQDNPACRGKVLGVCEHLGGIIIGASKEAKKWGITTGTPVWEARRIYPKIILTHTTPESFRHYTRRLIKLVSEYTDLIEVYSIDEVFLDITKVCNVKSPASDPQDSNESFADPFEEAINIALDIKKRVGREVGDWLTCSIGIAENKVLAKIASDMKKPDGLVIIAQRLKQKAQNIPAGCLFFAKGELYHRLKLTDVPGIGPRLESRLNRLGIKTLLDLKDYPKSRLVALFGVPGHHLYNLGQLDGSFKPSVEQAGGIKSMGHMYTLPKEYRKPEFFEPVLFKLCEMVARRLRNKNLRGEILTFYAHDADCRPWGKSRRLGFFIDDGREIFMQAREIYRRMGIKTGIFRLIGVTISGLKEKAGQRSLFGVEERRSRLASSLDKINDKYGEFTISRAPVLVAGRVFRDSVGFGRVKEL